MKKSILLHILVFLFFYSCGGKSDDSGNENSLPVIYASIPPLEFVLEYLCGDDFEVRSLLGENDNPHTYSIKPSDLHLLKEAEVLVQIGEGFENYLTDSIRSGLKDLEIIDIAPHLTLLGPEEQNHETEEAGQSGGDEHNHDGFDPHFWLGIPQIVEYAEFICSELIRLYPSKKDLLNSQLAGFKITVKEVDEADRQILESGKSNSFLVFHPSYSYFAQYYNLQQIAVEVDGKAPSPKQLKNAIETAEKYNIRVVISQPQFSSTGIEAIAQAIGGRVIEINHLKKDIFSTMTELCLALTGSNDGP